VFKLLTPCVLINLFSSTKPSKCKYSSLVFYLYNMFRHCCNNFRSSYTRSTTRYLNEQKVCILDRMNDKKVGKFLFNKTNRRTNFPNLFRQEIPHVSGISSAHHQEFIHCTFGTAIYHASLKTYTRAECTVNRLLMMGRGNARNMWNFLTK